MLETVLLNLSLVSAEIPHGCVYDCGPAECTEGAGCSVGAGHFMP